jgi:hypothetical protein
MKILNYFVILLIAVAIECADSNCKIKMSNSKMSIFKDQEKLIFNEGYTDPTWNDNANIPYVANSDEDIQYFYIMENKLTDFNNKDKIVHFII